MSTLYSIDCKLRRVSNASAQSQGQNVKLTATTEYRIRVDEDPPPTVPPSTDPECTYTLENFITPLMLARNERGVALAMPTKHDLPVAQLDQLYCDGYVWPFMHCESVDFEQNPKATQEIKATAKWGTLTFTEVKPPELAPKNVANLATEADYPVIYQDDLRIIDHVIYEDNTTPTPQRCELPTGNLFTQPFIQKVPTRIVRVTQYEQAFTEELAAARLETVNNADWNGTGTANKWKITDIQWQPVRIVLAGPSVLDTFMVQYEVSYMPKPAGWRSNRALLDTHYLTTANDQSTRQPFVTSEGGRTNYIGMVKNDGTPDANQIHYKEFLVQPEISFSFLRAENP